MRTTRLRPVVGWLGEYAAYLFVRSLVAVIGVLPLDMGDRICRWLARLVNDVLGIRRSISQENIDASFPAAEAASRRDLERAMWHHLLLMVCEIAWAHRRIHRCNWNQHVRFRGNKTMLAYLLSVRPAVIVTGHYGNFEVGGYMLGVIGIPTTAIARQLDNRFLHRWVETTRQTKGQSMVDKEGCAPVVDRLLKAGGKLSLLADQHAGPKGCWVSFMNRPASCHKALALFSLGSQAPMMVSYTRRIGGRPLQFEIGCLAVADPANADEQACQSVTALTQWYNRRLADAIELSVEQYWWLHRRWRTPPERIARRLVKRAA